MVVHSVEQLLVTAIDTPLKLHCVMVFAQKTISRGTAAQVARRLMRDIWSTQQALEELAAAEVLSVAAVDGEPVYEYKPAAEYVASLRNLVATYEDPVARDSLYESVRELALYAPYRTAFAQISA